MESTRVILRLLALCAFVVLAPLHLVLFFRDSTHEEEARGAMMAAGILFIALEPRRIAKESR